MLVISNRNESRFLPRQLHSQPLNHLEAIFSQSHIRGMVQPRFGIDGKIGMDRIKPVTTTVASRFSVAAPVAEWVRSLFFSALNHSIISPLCLV